MSITHNLSFGWSSPSGGTPLNQTVAAVGGREANVSTQIPAVSVAALSLDWTNAKLQDFVVFTDQTLTLTTNGVAQVETATIVGTITGSGNATIVVTAAGMTGSPRTVSVPVLNGDTASVVAGKVRTALAADVDVGAFFNIGGTGAAVVATALLPAANDSSLNIASDNGTCTGLTTESTSANTTAGVSVQDTIVVTASKPFVWYSGSGITNPFSGNVTGVNATNYGSSAANLSVRTLETAP